MKALENLKRRLENANGWIDLYGTAVKLSIVHTIECEPSKFIEAMSGGWPKVISNLKSQLETGSIALQDPYPTAGPNART